MSSEMYSSIVFVIIDITVYPIHHLTATLLPNLLPADSSRNFVQNHFDQRLTEIDREGTFSLPELVTDHQVTGTKIDYRIHSHLSEN